MKIVEILKKYWGYDNFRPLQEDIINSVIHGQDTLGLMPTGGGKSITFQVPGLYFPKGVTIVVTPLISLMKDQVDNLRRRRIKAVFFHSGMTAAENRITWEKLVNGNARFLYISPERIKNERFINEIRNIDVNLIVIDEAHCISQWGYDFRPSYLNIRSLRKIKPDVNILALTATATPEVVKDIMKQLDFRNGICLRKSFVRDNISYIVRKTSTKIHEVLHILSRTSGSAIVYVRSRKRCRQIAEFLQSADITATYYHAGLDYKVKEIRQNDWQKGICRVMVATNAFGMGIDKPDVRVVIHYDIPPSLEEYYQEAGRAGRDGYNSYAVLLVSDPDKGTIHRRVTEAFPERKVVKEIYEKICDFLHVSIGEGYDTVKQFDIRKFCIAYNVGEQLCRSSLRLLSQAGYMQFVEEPDSRSRLKMVCDHHELYEIHDLSPVSEQVLMTTLRLYTGLFSDYAYIWEPEIATKLQIPEEKVYESMLELSRRKIVSYVPHSDVPMIYFPTSREDKKYVMIGIDIYENRKDVMSKRIESMIDYSFVQTSCRVERMLRYFGEEDSGKCGKCDVCRENLKKSKSKNEERSTIEHIINVIISYMKENPTGVSLQQLQTKCKSDNTTVAQILTSLCNEGFITCLNERYYLTTH